MYSSISTNKVYAFGGDISNHFTPYSSLLDSKWRRHFQEYVRRIFVVAAPSTEYSKRSFFFLNLALKNFYRSLGCGCRSSNPRFHEQ